MIVFAPLFILYSIFSGITEGILYSRRGSDAFGLNEHIVYVSSRIVLALVFLLPDNGDILEKGVIIVFWLLAHSFFHDGAYFETRRRIDVSWYRFWTDRSKTSTAHFEIGFIERSVMCVVGIVGVVIYEILTWAK